MDDIGHHSSFDWGALHHYYWPRCRRPTIPPISEPSSGSLVLHGPFAGKWISESSRICDTNGSGSLQWADLGRFGRKYRENADQFYLQLHARKAIGHCREI